MFRCDTKNIGMTMLCKFDGDVPLPAVWSYQVCSLHSYLVSFILSYLNNYPLICFFLTDLDQYMQVLNEYKKSYPEEELPDFLKYCSVFTKLS